MDKLRILMGIPAPWIKGGPATHLPHLVKYFANDDRFEIKTFYFGSKKQLGTENIFEKVFYTSKTLLKYLRLIISFKPHVIQLNTAFDKMALFRDVPFSLVSKLTGKSLFFKVHGGHGDLINTKNFILIFMIRVYFWGASKIGVLSEFEKNEFIERFGNASKLIVVKNIVIKADSDFWLNPQNMNKRYDALFISRIEKGKGLEDLLDAIPLIVKSYPTFKLAIAGNGRALNEYQKKAEDLNIISHISWLGHIPNDELVALYSQSKIFVFPSHFPEGMPMAMVEALRYGMPVITTTNRFAISYLKEEENVLFIEKHQPEQIAKKFLYLINNNSIQNKMKVKNTRFVINFNEENVGHEFSQIYHQMANIFTNVSTVKDTDY